jgi:UDP-N-acetylmuramate dehydrogenase
MERRQISELVNIGGEAISLECPMDRYTTFHVGGKADVLYHAGSSEELQRMIAYLHKESIPCMVVGKGSNLLFPDEGYRGVVILLKGLFEAVDRDRKKRGSLLAGGGVGLSRLLSFCRSHDLGGLEFLAGIPGTLGGAVVMNAGAFGRDMGDVIGEVHLITAKGETTVLDSGELSFSYRHLAIPEGSVVVKARLALNFMPGERVAMKMEEYLARRKREQPSGLPSAGSIFKNPPDDHAGRLIEMVGLKGKKIGGAMISPNHANWIVNTGGAKAKDILSLMELVRKTVLKETGIKLEPEIKIAGSHK